MSSALFPYSDPLIVDGQAQSAQEIITKLGPLVTAHRWARIQEVIARRTFSVVAVLEDIYDRGNISAVMRSSEAMGFQAVEVIEKGARFKDSKRVSRGAEKWLDVRKWSATEPCLERLKAAGYQILVTRLEGSRPINQFSFAGPTAIVLGNEKAGVSPAAVQLADGAVCVPMHGFVQSFNISVAAALIFYHIRQWREAELGKNCDLSPAQQKILAADFLLRTVAFCQQSG